MRYDPLCVTATLATPLSGDAGMLDAILVYIASRLAGKPAGVPNGLKVDRRTPCPDASGFQIYVPRVAVGEHRIPLTTAPILDAPTNDGTEFVCKRLATEHAGLLAPAERKVVVMTNTWTKAYRIPVRVRTVRRVAWLCMGNRAEIKSLLKEVHAIGTRRRAGYGRVLNWAIDRVDVTPHKFWPWWAESETGPVLMRPLPADWSGLPVGLLGSRRGYGAVTAPYWHPDRYCERVEPC